MNITLDKDFENIAKRHPHISKKIELLWGHIELRHYLNSLFIDTRDGIRQGFEPHIAKSIFAIINKLDDHLNYSEHTCIWHNRK